MQTKSYISGGKLGDFIYGTMICNYEFITNGIKANLYIANIGDSFETSLESTFEALYPIISKQIWCNSFQIYNNEAIDVNLTDFRQSKWLYNCCWNELYFNTHLNQTVPPNEYKWIEFDTNPLYKNTLIVNRSNKPLTQDCIEVYKQIFTKFDDIKFVCYHKSQYDAFVLKEYCELILVKDLVEFFTIINSCKMFVGNMSGALSWASAMNVPRIAEISGNGKDANFCYNEGKYYSNFSWF
jgi:hypothetical protein